MLLKPFTLHAPKTLAEATDLYSSLEGARLLAGGTFLINNLKLLKKKGLKTPQNIISLRKVDELRGIALVKDNLIIKAMTTVNDLLDSPLLTGDFSILGKVCRNIATTPIRNMATIGGNLTCRYTWTELGTVMVALDARMHFIEKGGKEETLSVEEFFLNAAKTDKLFSHVSIKRDQSAVTSYQRVAKSPHIDIPLLAVCVRASVKGKSFANTRVSINNGTVFAQRDTALEEFLNQAPRHEKTAQEALKNLNASLYDTRSDDYKKHMFRVSIKKAIEEMTAGKNKK